jgi:hypothetical protein
MPKHPIDELTFRSGTLAYRYGRAEGPAPYLDTPAVKIVDKRGHRELPSSNDVAYRFELNTRPDQTWIEFFGYGSKDIRANILGQHLEISCIPANLVSHYNKAKAAIEHANQLYAEHKQALIEQIKGLDAQRDHEAKTKETRSETIQDQFEKLEL